MLPVVSNAESIVSEKSMHDTILPWRNGKNLKKDVILDCSMIKSKLSRAVLLYWKGVSNMSNKRIIKAVYYTTASISRRMVAIVTNIMMAPAKKDIYTVGDWIRMTGCRMERDRVRPSGSRRRNCKLPNLGILL